MEFFLLITQHGSETFNRDGDGAPARLPSLPNVNILICFNISVHDQFYVAVKSLNFYWVLIPKLEEVFKTRCVVRWISQPEIISLIFFFFVSFRNWSGVAGSINFTSRAVLCCLFQMCFVCCLINSHLSSLHLIISP